MPAVAGGAHQPRMTYLCGLARLVIGVHNTQRKDPHNPDNAARIACTSPEPSVQLLSAAHTHKVRYLFLC